MRFAFTNSVWQQSTVHVRGNNLFGSQYQCKLPLKTQLPSEIAAAAFRSFKERYSWNTKVKADTVRSIELSPKDSVEQLTLFDNVQHRMAMEEVQDALEGIRGRFGKSAISYACLMGDLKMPTDGRDKAKMLGLMYLFKYFLLYVRAMKR